MLGRRGGPGRGRGLCSGFNKKPPWSILSVNTVEPRTEQHNRTPHHACPEINVLVPSLLLDATGVPESALAGW